MLSSRDANIPMWKDPDLVLDYASFWSRRDLFQAYVIPAVPAENIAKYELGLSSSAKRIEGNRSRERAQQIFHNLQVLDALPQTVYTLVSLSRREIEHANFHTTLHNIIIVIM
jgi:hypothetical protein